MRTYWIWNPYKRYWHNGVYTITESILVEGLFSNVQNMYYNATGLTIKREQFELFRFPPVKDAEWRPKSPEEVMRILNDETSN